MSRAAKVAKLILCTTLVGGLMTSSYYIGLDKGLDISTEHLQQMNTKLKEVEYKLQKTEDRLVDLKVGYEIILNTVNVDVFKVTAYSPYDDRNGINSDGNPSVTSTGTKPGPGTIAVNPEIIPYGSELVILYEDGTIEIGRAEDTGAAMRRPGNMQIDVYRDTFSEASRHGVKRAIVIWR